MIRTMDAARNDQPLKVDEAVVAVRPPLLDLGGQQRMVLVVGTEREREKLELQVRDLHGGSVTVAVIPGSSPKLIHEAQLIEVQSVLSRLHRLNGDTVQITRRLSSRTDVDWS